MGASFAPSWKDRIRQERIRRNWRQQDLADQLGTTVITIQRWERGAQQPGAYFRTKLCALFGKSPEEMGFVDLAQEASEDLKETKATSLSFWHVPYPRNPFFTGRDDILANLHKQLRHSH